MIELTTDFECCNGKSVDRLSTNHFKFQVLAASLRVLSKL